MGDKQAMLVKKWHTLIEAHTKVKTTDGYVPRIFALAFTKRRQDQTKATCYAGSGQVRRIRKKIVQKEASKSQLRELVKKLLPEALGTEIEKATRSIFPLQNCLVRKVKMLKKPKFDLTKLMELHQNSGDDHGMEMIREEAEEAKNALTAEVEAD